MDQSFHDENGVSAPAWDYVKRLNTPVTNSRGTLCHHICTLCIEGGRPFSECILRVYFKENKKGEGVPRSARANKHLESRHPDVWSRINANNSSFGKRKQAQSLKPADSDKRRTNPPRSSGTNIQRSSNSTNYDTYISFVRMILKNRIPLYTSGTNASTSFLRSVYRNSYLKLESEKCDLIIDVLFARMIMAIKESIRETREYFKASTTKQKVSNGSTFSFLTVVHSKWEPNSDSNSFGIGLRWINPKSKFQFNNVAIGILKGCPGSSSIKDAVKSAGDIIQKVGVAEDDILYSFITNHSGVSRKNEMNIVQHILLESIVHFEADLLQEARELILFISESPHWDMRIRLQYRNQENILGIFEMIRLLLLSHHCINDFFNQDVIRNVNEKQNLTRLQWQTLAEIEALIRPVVYLQMDTKDLLPTISMFWLHIQRVQHLYAKEEYKVIDFLNTSCVWEPNEAFDKLPTKILYVYDDNAIRYQYGSDGDIGANMSGTTLQILQRFKLKLDDIVADPSEEQLIAMLCDPIVMTAGRLVVKSNSKIWEAARTVFKAAIVAEAASLSGSQQVEIQQSTDADDIHVVADGSDMVVDDYISQLRSAAAEREMVSSGAENHQDSRVADELSRWFSIKNIDWEEEYFLQNPSLSKKNRCGQIFERAKLDCPYYLYEKINPLEWWSNKMHTFPFIHRIAARYLPIPVENFGRFFHSLPFSPAYTSRQLGYPRYEQVVIQSFNSEWQEIVDNERDITSMKNALTKGKRSQIEKYLETLYDFEGKAAKDSNGMQTEMFIKDVQTFIQKVTSCTARS